MMKRAKLLPAALIIGGLTALAACSPPDTASPGGEESAGGSKEVTMAVFNGWDEGIAASELWKAILEDKGYTVEFEYQDVAAVFTGLSTDDYDVVLDTWLPITHKSYVDKFPDLVDLGAWNEEAKLTVAVNEDAPVDSLADLAANADAFGSKIVGIESGAGLTKQVNDVAIPDYKLDDMEFVTSSTPAMLTELKAATDNGENIAVTLWRPHWAYDAFPIKDLEDPDGAMGDTESIHSYGSKSFEGNFPELAGWLKNFKMDSETLYSLENAMFNTEDKDEDDDEDDYGPIVEKWITENQEYVDGLTS